MKNRSVMIIIPVMLVLGFIAFIFFTRPGIEQITTSDLAIRLQDQKETVFVDVREEDEFNSGHIEGMINLPLSSLEENYSQIPKDSEVVLICRSGNRSMQAAEILESHGYTKLINVQGGMTSWNGPTVK